MASAAGGLQLSEFTQSGGIPQAIPVEGVDVAHPEFGPLASGTFGAGHNLSATDGSSDVAVLDANYAAANKLSVGATITLAGATFRVIGLVHQTQASGATDIYVPLGRAQALAQSSAGRGLTGQLNVIYVAAATSGETAAVQSEISRLLPAATVTSTSDLASEVSGSLASAADLTNDLGKWVAAAALLAAFAVASLLTTAAVNRRVREIGTLKALGWRTRRILTQIISESAVTGIIGAVIGIAIGYVGAAIVAPSLQSCRPPSPHKTGQAKAASFLSTLSLTSAQLLLSRPSYSLSPEPSSPGQSVPGEQPSSIQPMPSPKSDNHDPAMGDDNPQTRHVIGSRWTLGFSPCSLVIGPGASGKRPTTTGMSVLIEHALIGRDRCLRPVRFSGSERSPRRTHGSHAPECLGGRHAGGAECGPEPGDGADEDGSADAATQARAGMTMSSCLVEA